MIKIGNNLKIKLGTTNWREGNEKAFVYGNFDINYALTESFPVLCMAYH